MGSPVSSLPHVQNHTYYRTRVRKTGFFFDFRADPGSENAIIVKIIGGLL